MSHKIALSGCPGAGKTTLARGLSSQIRGNTRFKTIELVDEWARTYINKYGIKDIGDQILILEKQIKDELEYPESTDLIITDSPVFYSFLYGLDLADSSKHDSKMLSEIFQRLILLPNPHYELVFHLNPVLLPTQDGVRPEYQFDNSWRAGFNFRIKNLFTIFRPGKLIVVPDELDTLQDRIDFCLKHINRME